MDDSKGNDRVDRLFKATVAICLIFISIACALYSSDIYNRRAHEQKAWNYCLALVSARNKGNWPDEYAGLKDAVLWTAVHKCATTGDLN